MLPPGSPGRLQTDFLPVPDKRSQAAAQEGAQKGPTCGGRFGVSIGREGLKLIHGLSLVSWVEMLIIKRRQGGSYLDDSRKNE